MKTQIFRIVPSRSKKIFERFHARLRNVDIEQVQVKFSEDGSIERVDILYEDVVLKSKRKAGV